MQRVAQVRLMWWMCTAAATLLLHSAPCCQRHVPVLALQRYATEVGSQPRVFCGSSSGAVSFGSLRLRRKAHAAVAAGGTL